MKLRLAPIVAAWTVAGMRLVKLETWTGAAAYSSAADSEETEEEVAPVATNAADPPDFSGDVQEDEDVDEEGVKLQAEERDDEMRAREEAVNVSEVVHTDADDSRVPTTVESSSFGVACPL